MFHGGKLKAMPPKLLSDDKKHVIIRPLAYCKEQDIETYSAIKEFPIIPCNLCGSQERSEEHTSELQSRPHLVCRLLLEKKKKINKIHSTYQHALYLSTYIIFF